MLAPDNAFPPRAQRWMTLLPLAVGLATLALAPEPGAASTPAFPEEPDLTPGGPPGAEIIIGASDPLPEITAADPDGSQPHIDDVALFTGGYMPRIPLDVLPTNGPKPDLQLVYSAVRGNGIAGAGWGLAFESNIERKSATRGIPGDWTEPDDPIAGHRFFVDGQELIEFGDGTYRPIRDPFTVYRPITIPFLFIFDRIVAWEATRNGFTRTWGSVNGISLCTDGVEYASDACDRPVRWKLTRIEDSLGNVVELEYEAPSWGGLTDNELRPSRIVYAAGAHSIELAYEARPDIRVHRRDGIPRAIPERLATIVVQADRLGWPQISHRYRLEYLDAQADTQSLLHRVLREAVDPASGAVTGEQILIRELEYHDDTAAPGWANWEGIETTGADLTPPDYDFDDTAPDDSYHSNARVLDVNRDALPDYVVLNTECHWFTRTEDPQFPGDDGGGAITIREATCTPDHRVFLNEPATPGTPRFVYDELRSQQLDAYLGPVLQDGATIQPQDFFLVDINGDAYPDILKGTSTASYGETILLGKEDGWNLDIATRLVDAPWLGGVDGKDPFTELQLADIDGDGYLDLAGEERFILNSGSRPYFEDAAARDLEVRDTAGVPLSLPANLPPAVVPAGCMSATSGSRVVESQLGTYESFTGTLYQGTDNPDSSATPQQWVWRHTSFADYNGDGIADRLVSLAWPEEGSITLAFGSTPLWVHAGGACDGVNKLYMGNGDGTFSAAWYAVGGDYAWVDGPRSIALSETSVDDFDETQVVRFMYRRPVNHLAMSDTDGNGRPELVQVCEQGARSMVDHGAEATADGRGFRVETNVDTCPDKSVQLPLMWTGSAASGSLLTLVGAGDDGVFGGAMDMNGDSFSDFIVAHNPIHPTDTNRLGSEIPHWSKNQRTVAQSRLVALIGPYGGRTEVEWTTSALQANVVASAVPVVATITDGRGRTEFEFKQGAMLEKRFAGFGIAEARGTSGVVKQFELETDKPVLGALRRRATYWADGTLHELDVFSTDTDGLASSQPDSEAPYFNPVRRSCKFAFYGSYTGRSTYLHESSCDNFVGEPRAENSGYRLLVTEDDYDDSLGVLVERRELRDATTADDSTTTTYVYHPYDATLVASLLDERKTTDSVGNVRDHHSYPLGDYVGVNWGKEVQYDDVSSRSRSRGFTDGAQSWQTSWGETRRIDYERDQCGEVSRESMTGRENTITRDEICRIVQRTTSSGIVEDLAYDDFHRVTSHTVNPMIGPSMVTEYAYDRSSSVSEPTKVIIMPEPDGSTTVEKTYVDEHGREWKTTRCKRGALPDSWSNSLDEAYGCAVNVPAAGEYAISMVTLYSQASGLVRVKTDAFDARDGTVALGGAPAYPEYTPAVALTGQVPLVESVHDVLGRVVQDQHTDAPLVTYAYDVGSEVTTSRGISTERVVTTMSEDLYRNSDLIGTDIRNAFGEQVAAVDALGFRTDTSFNGYGQPTSESLPEVAVYSSCTSSTLLTPTRSTTYTVTGEAETETDENGNTTTHSYDSYGRLTQVVGPGLAVLRAITYVDTADSDRRREETDELGAVTITWLDGLDRPRKIQLPDGAITEITYDERGRESTRILPTGEVTSIAYDRAGRPRETTRTMGAIVATSTVVYDARDNIVRTEDADGRIVEHTFDGASRLVESTLGDPTAGVPRLLIQNTYDADGRLEETVEDGVVTRLTYDAHGRLSRKQVGYQAGAVPEQLLLEDYAYTARDEVGSVINALGEGEFTTYDSHGRVIESGSIGRSGAETLKTSGYDAAGNVVRSTDEAGAATCVEYDAYHRPELVTPPGLGTTEIRYRRGISPPTLPGVRTVRIRSISPTGEWQDVYRDSADRVVAERAPDGTQVDYVYESSLLVRRRKYAAAGTLLAVKPTTYYLDSSRVDAAFDWMAPASVPACLAAPALCPTGRVARGYTAGGRVDSITDAQGNVTTVDYSTEGAMLPEQVALGDVTTMAYAYDPSYALISSMEVGSTADPIMTSWTRRRNLQVETITRELGGMQELSAYTFDDGGRRVSGEFTRDGITESAIDWTYDDFGRLATKSYELAAAPGRTFTLSWAYESTGQLASVTYPSGNVASYFYDADSRIDRVVLGAAYGDPLVADYRSPDGAGRFLTTELADGSLVERTYVDGRQQTRTVSANGVVAFDESYTYAGSGHLSAIQRSLAAAGTENSVYTYNRRDLLTAETHEVGADVQSVQYTYNAAGQRTRKHARLNGSVVLDDTYTYHSGHRLASVGAASIPLTSWDAYGRMIADHRGQTLSYGLANQLVEVVSAGGTVETMMHDVAGQRVARSVNGAIDIYLSSDVPGEVLYHERPDGSSQDIVRSLDGGILAVVSGAGDLEPVVSGRADSKQLIGDPTAPAAERLHDAFGALIGGSASDDVSQLGFHQTWSTTGDALRVAGVRALDTETGRFTSIDPLGLASAADLNDSADWYRYAHNNPIAMSDSTGFLGVPPPPETTTIVVDGIVMEVINAQSWNNGTIQVANQAAYIAGVRAGLKKEYEKQAVQDLVDQLFSEYDAALSSAVTGTAGPQRSEGGRSAASEAQTATSAADAAETSIEGSGSEQGETSLVSANATSTSYDLDGNRLGPSTSDPLSFPYFARVKDGRGNERLVGALSPELVAKIAAEGGLELVSEVRKNTLEEIEVRPAEDNRSFAQRGVDIAKAFGWGAFDGTFGEAYRVGSDLGGNTANLIQWSLGYRQTYLQNQSSLGVLFQNRREQGYGYFAASTLALTYDAMDQAILGGLIALEAFDDGEFEVTAEFLGGVAGSMAVGAAMGRVAPTVRIPGKKPGSTSIKAINKPCCFVAGTQVRLASGQRAIEELRPGDLVLARDHAAYDEDGTPPSERIAAELEAMISGEPAHRPRRGAPVATALGPRRAPRADVPVDPGSAHDSTEVRRFDSRTGQFVPTRLREVRVGDDLWIGDTFHRLGIDGVLYRVPAIAPELVADAHRAYDRRSSRPPANRDVVWLVESDPGGPAAGHYLLHELSAGSTVLFQGKQYSIENGPDRWLVDTGLVVLPIRRTFVRSDRPVWDLTVRDSTGRTQTISGTPDHPFYVPSRDGYVPLASLQPGGDLRTEDDLEMTVIAATDTGRRDRTYNFEVGEVHNYFVAQPGRPGAPGILVHNTNCPGKTVIRRRAGEPDVRVNRAEADPAQLAAKVQGNVRRDRQTIAAANGRKGGDSATVVGGGARDLSPSQRRVATDSGARPAKLRRRHAEPTVVEHMKANGIRPTWLEATNNFCAGCRAYLIGEGATIIGPKTAIWKWK